MIDNVCAHCGENEGGSEDTIWCADCLETYRSDYMRECAFRVPSWPARIIGGALYAALWPVCQMLPIGWCLDHRSDSWRGRVWTWVHSWSWWAYERWAGRI